MKSSGLIRRQYLTDGKLHQARELRKRMTSAEKILWQYLRKNQLGFKFRRQQIVEGFIVDFFCEKAMLTIEIDGLIHQTKGQRKIDELRRKVFEAKGLKEIRFKNEEIEENIDLVISEIRKHLLPFTLKD